MPLKLMQIVMCIDSLFLFIVEQYSIIWLYHSFLSIIHLLMNILFPVLGHHRVAVNIHAQVFV